MAWKQVKVKLGKHNVEAMLDGNRLDNVPNLDIELGDSISVDGVSKKIVSSVLTRDNVYEIILAGASSNNKEKSEDGDKQVKG